MPPRTKVLRMYSAMRTNKMHSSGWMSQPINQLGIPVLLKHFALPEPMPTMSPKYGHSLKDKKNGDPSSPKLPNIREYLLRSDTYTRPLSSDGQRELGAGIKIVTNLNSVRYQRCGHRSRMVMYILKQHEYIRKLIALFVSVMHLRHPDNLNLSSQTLPPDGTDLRRKLRKKQYNLGHE